LINAEGEKGKRSKRRRRKEEGKEKDATAFKILFCVFLKTGNSHHVSYKLIHCRRSVDWWYRCYSKMNLIVRDDIQWELPEELVHIIMSYWDVPTLIKNKAVCLTWKRICTAVIDDKAPIHRKAFLSGDELRSAVGNYSRCNATQAEEFAATYGWPIGNWDVSKVRDFSRVFLNVNTFNERIGSWDVSNSTTMRYMFQCAKSF